MAVMKCKMCGGNLAAEPGVTVAECEYCGTKQTLPKANDETLQNLFNRANNLRLKCEFDKAAQIYEKIVQMDDSEAEAHWGIILCKYGIEYVEDPKTLTRIPTCHRTLFEAVTTDADYLAAIDYSDAAQQSLYEREARAIDRIQKDILAIVKNEKPFDVFICYKESDENGKRTVDSAIANDIYHQLTQEGFKVFYAAITLEDKLGQEYEPYIFAALNSAKVMLVLGTKPEYFTAVWVKNEWSRFMQLMKTDRSKLLIPCYRDMDAYDLPEEFAHLQAQDMSKIGFINDVVRGIRKIAAVDTSKAPQQAVPQETTPVAANFGTAPLLKRAFMFLEDGDWNSANEYCEKVLDIDPENPSAYLGKLLSELRVRKQESLKDCAEPFDHSNNYQKAVRFADEELKATLTGYIEHINTRNENERMEGVYIRAQKAMSLATTENVYKEAAGLFESIGEYKDAAILAQECYEKAEILRKDAILSVCKKRIDAKLFTKDWSQIIKHYTTALNSLESISGWKDADEQIVICKKKIEETKAEEEAERLELARNVELANKKAEKATKIVIIAVPIFCAIMAFIIVLFAVIIPNTKYNDAVELMESGKYTEAISAFEALDGYKDSDAKIDECNTAIRYNDAVVLMDAGEYAKAISAFEALDGYKDSADKINECNTAIVDGKYNDAIALMEAGEYAKAISVFEALEGYRDSAAKIYECNYNYAVALVDAGEYAEAAVRFGAAGNYSNAHEKATALWDEIAVRDVVSAGGSHTAGLKSDGTVVAVGFNGDGRCNVSDWRDIVAVSAGYAHTVGLKSDGTVVATGQIAFGECNVSSWTDIVAVSARSNHTVGLKADGTVVATGSNDVSGWRDIVAVSAGSTHTVGLKSDGMVVAVGENFFGQCDVSGWRDIVAVSVGYTHTVGLKSDGTVVATGSNRYGQCDVSGWRDIVAVFAGSTHTVGLKSDGTVVATGNNEYGQCDVSGWRDIVAVSAGSHTVGLKADGTVVAVGYNDDGQCDVSGWRDIRIPQN